MFISLNFNIIFNSSRTNITLKHYSILILCTTFVTKRIYIIGKRKILYHDTKNVENYLVYIISDIQIDSFLTSSIAPLSLSFLLMILLSRSLLLTSFLCRDFIASQPLFIRALKFHHAHYQRFLSSW